MQKRKNIILCFVVLLLLCFVGCKEEITVDAPPTIQYNDEHYSELGGYIDTPTISKEYIGKVKSEVPYFEFPKNNFEINRKGFLNCKIYMLDDGDIIVEYKGEQYGDWRRFTRN